jgi:hypothetical protein
MMTSVLAHRLILSAKGKSAYENAEKVMKQISLSVDAPTR